MAGNTTLTINGKRYTNDNNAIKILNARIPQLEFFENTIEINDHFLRALTTNQAELSVSSSSSRSSTSSSHKRARSRSTPIKPIQTTSPRDITSAPAEASSSKSSTSTGKIKVPPLALPSLHQRLKSINEQESMERSPRKIDTLPAEEEEDL